MSTTVKRQLMKSFINSGTSGSPSWQLLGDGITDLSISYNPEVLKEQYIHQDYASSEVSSYAPSASVSMTGKSGDPAFDYLDAMRRNLYTGVSAQSELVNVYLYTSGSSGAYAADKSTVDIAFEQFGGPSSEGAKMDFTIHFDGIPTKGTFNPTTKIFTAS